MQRRDLIEAIARQGDITLTNAERVLETYQAERIVTVSGRDGYQVRHDAFLDRVVIRHAAFGRIGAASATAE